VLWVDQMVQRDREVWLGSFIRAPGDLDILFPSGPQIWRKKRSHEPTLVLWPLSGWSLSSQASHWQICSHQWGNSLKSLEPTLVFNDWTGWAAPCGHWSFHSWLLWQPETLPQKPRTQWREMDMTRGPSAVGALKGPGWPYGFFLSSTEGHWLH
jgi:hypothetical protein